MLCPVRAINVVVNRIEYCIERSARQPEDLRRMQIYKKYASCTNNGNG